MNTIKNNIKAIVLPALLAGIIFTSCNKDVRQFGLPAVTAQSGISLDSLLRATPNDSLYYRMVVKASTGPINYVNLLKAVNVTNQYTLFVPDNNGMKIFINAASGGVVPLAAPDAVFSGFITNFLPLSAAAGIVGYNTIPQRYDTAAISPLFPNMQVGTLIQIAPTTAPFVTLTSYPSKRGSQLWVNNIPMIAPLNVPAYNGIVQHVFTVVSPPQRLLWERLNTDADLTIFKAAILRADSGTAAPGALVTAFLTGPANFNVFAPTNAAMKAFLSAATGGAIPVAAPDAVFIGFLGSNSITTRLVKGIVVYHFFDDRNTTLSPAVLNKRPGRAYTVNFPPTPTAYPTLLSSADSIGVTFKPVTLAATFTGPAVSAATVKGDVNPTASNLLINSTPDNTPSYGATPPALPVVYIGTSDQNYVNGVLHKIDQVLRPQ